MRFNDVMARMAQPQTFTYFNNFLARPSAFGIGPAVRNYVLRRLGANDEKLVDLPFLIAQKKGSSISARPSIKVKPHLLKFSHLASRERALREPLIYRH